MILSDAQLSGYEELGFIDSIPVLSSVEVRRYRAEIEKTCQALGGNVTRLDAPHLFFRWAWSLATHPRLLDCMEQLLGPNILLKSTRLFYKHGHSASYVGWHQDGITEKLEGAFVPAVWLGLTPATAENGCLRVVPGSHRLGLVAHADRPDPHNLTSYGSTARASVDLVRDIDNVRDIVMRPGEMSLHHPLVLHASNPNRSGEPRIGFSATYSGAPIPNSQTEVVWVRGRGARHRMEVTEQPARVPLKEAVAAYRHSGHQILFAGARTAM